MTEKTELKRSTKAKPQNLANAEIDSRLAAAIRDRAKAMQMVSKLAHWQDRLARLEQEINSLIGFQQRLSGKTAPDTAAGVLIAQVPGFRPFEPPPFAGRLADIPDGVTSIPTKVANPKPSGSNVAEEFMNDKGFS